VEQSGESAESHPHPKLKARLDLSDLEEFHRSALSYLGPSKPSVVIDYAVASEVLINLLGPAWWEEWVLSAGRACLIKWRVFPNESPKVSWNDLGHLFSRVERPVTGGLDMYRR
jgi:hypothetical protein